MDFVKTVAKTRLKQLKLRLKGFLSHMAQTCKDKDDMNISNIDTRYPEERVFFLQEEGKQGCGFRGFGGELQNKSSYKGKWKRYIT